MTFRTYCLVDTGELSRHPPSSSSSTALFRKQTTSQVEKHTAPEEETIPIKRGKRKVRMTERAR